MKASGTDPLGVADILEVEQIGTDVWRAWTPPGSGRSDIFGGQVAGQALRAAALTVDPGHLPNSLHGYFLRRGQPDLPIDLHVERVRGGRTYTSRQVDARQAGKTIFSLQASFHAPEPGREFDHPMAEDIPDPEGLPVAFEGAWRLPLDLRDVAAPSPLVRWWGRFPRPFPEDPVLHFCALLYASDIRAGGAAMAAVGYGLGVSHLDAQGRPLGNFGSLDHALWFHRTPAVDEWFFCDVQPLIARDSRGLVIGTIFDRERRHLATFTQEMFLKGLEYPT